MRWLPAWLASLGALAALIACSSSEETPVSIPDAGAQTTRDAGPAETPGPADAAPEAASANGALACETLDTAITATQTTVKLGAANQHPFAQAPKAEGGTIVEGTYRLIGYERYNEGTTNPAGTLKATIQVKDGLWETVSEIGDGIGGTPSKSTGGGAYRVNGTKIEWVTPGCGPSPSGPSNAKFGPTGLYEGPYTATPTTLTFVLEAGNATTPVVMTTTYAKD